jgi:RNA polymerase sigma factor (sigma-70 family)
MRATGTQVVTLVVAAQAGDRRALDDLVTAHLPLVYTIVRRALTDDPDTDDVVQDTMLRAVRELRTLHDPQTFKTWLATIAVRQVGTHLRRRRLTATRTQPLDDSMETPDADFETLTVLGLDLSHQRRQVVRASRWLDPDDRVLLSLWWLELAGQLSRAELADAAGISIAHAGVSLQRMHAQLVLTRSMLAAIETRPRCAGLDAALAPWDGHPSPLWRKRIARHTRSCAICAPAAHGMIAADRLLVGFTLLAVPLALTTGVLGKIALGVVSVGATSTAAVSTMAGAATTGAGAGVGASASAKVGIVAQFIAAIAAHPIAATILAGAIIAGAGVTTANWPTSQPPTPTNIGAPTSANIAAPTSAPTPTLRPTPAPTPTPTPTATSRTAVKPPPTAAQPLTAGPASLAAANQTGLFIATADTYGVLIPVDSTSDSQTRRQATFDVVAGLADANCFSFRLPDGQFLRHSSWRLRVFANDGSALFRGDATFCVRAGSVTGSISLESSNYPGWYLRHRGNELWVDQADGSATFHADSSFLVRPPL